MKRSIKIGLVALSFLFGKDLNAQVDPHFTQYYVYPSWLNPALTGIHDGDYRVGAVYRNQWSGINKPFVTAGAAFDMPTNKNINFGLSLMNQTAGNGGYSYTTGYASASYTGIRFGQDESQRISFGMQAGVINRRFNPSKFTLGDQWNPATGYSPSNPTLDFTNTNRSLVFDAGAGVMYIDGTPGKKANIFGGYSASHLTQPQDPFLDGQKEKLPIRHTVHGGVRLAVSDEVTITPNVLYLRQGNAEEKMIGAYAQMPAGVNTEFLFGANYRFKDAVTPFVGFFYNNFLLGASYDITTSDLSKAMRGANSFEISLTYIGKKAFKPREEHFVCPRL